MISIAQAGYVRRSEPSLLANGVLRSVAYLQTAKLASNLSESRMGKKKILSAVATIMTTTMINKAAFAAGIACPKMNAPEQSSVTPLSGLVWPGNVITWAFGTPTSTRGLGLGNITNAITDPLQQTAVTQGIENWPRVGSLEIVRVSDPRKAMVEIGYGNDSSFQLLGQSVWRYQPETKKFTKVVITLQDPSISPLSKGSDGALTYSNNVELQQLAAHEFGVALGLAEGPGTDGCSVMNHVLTSANRTPDAADIAALRKIYAASFHVAQLPTLQPPRASHSTQGPAPSAQPVQPQARPEAATTGESPAQELGRRAFRGAEYPSATAKDVLYDAEVYEQQLHQQIDNLLKSNLTGQDLVNAVRKVDGQTADTLQRVIDNKGGIPDAGNFGSGLTEYWNMIQNLAVKAEPSWNAQQFRWAQQFMGPNGPVESTFATAAALAEAAVQVLGSLKAIPSNTNIPINAWKAFIDGKITDPAYSNLFVAWRLYAMEYAHVGGFSEDHVDTYMKYVMPLYGTPLTMREILKIHTAIADALIKFYGDLWHHEGLEGEAPGYPPDAEAIFGAIRRMDPNTGRIPGDVPRRLRDVVP